MLFTIGCVENAIRLVGGANYTEGRVEICLSNEWGTVCNRAWTETNAAVVCRQLHLDSTGNLLEKSFSKLFNAAFVISQVHKFSVQPVLEQAQGGSGWTMCSAQGLRDHSSTVQPVPVESTPAHMLKMLESDVNLVME